MRVEEDVLVGAVIGSASILPTNLVGGLPFKAIAVTIVDNDDEPALTYQNYKFIQTEELTSLGVAVHPYGAIIIDINLAADASVDTLLVVEFNGKQYGAPLMQVTGESVGTPISFELIEDEGGGGDEGGNT